MKPKNIKPFEDKNIWIGKVINGRIVPPPMDGFSGYSSKNADQALRDYQQEYPRSKFVKCKCLFIPIE